MGEWRIHVEPSASMTVAITVRCTRCGDTVAGGGECPRCVVPPGTLLAQLALTREDRNDG